MKKILVPVDFSTQSEYATNLAAKIARNSNIKVYLLHTIKMPSGQIDMGSGSRFSVPESMLYLQKVKEKLQSIIDHKFEPDADVRYSILFNEPFEGITEFNAKINADLIIMTSKKSNDLDEIMIGSTTQKVTNNSKTPVLVVKKDIAMNEIKELVFASTFKEDSKKPFSLFLNFAQKFDSNIHLLKISPFGKNNEPLKETIDTFLSSFHLSKYTIHESKDPSIERGVANFSKEVNADLIALSVHRRSYFSRIFKGSITKNFTKRALKPVLSFLI